MDYICHFCQNQIELPDLLDTSTTCQHCDAEIYPDSKAYTECKRCKIKYLSCNLNCPECDYQEVVFKNISLDKINYVYIKSHKQYYQAISFLNQIDVISLDTEGNTLDPFNGDLFLIQLGNKEIVYIFDFKYFEYLKEENFWCNKLFIMHNAKFDYKMLKHFLNIEIENIFDTYLAERILTCGLSRENSLKAIAQKYLNINLDKSLRLDFINMNKYTFHKLVTHELIEYSARDVLVLDEIYRIQNILLRNENLAEIAELEFEVAKVMGDIELAGIYVDVQQWTEIKKHNEKERDRVKNLIISQILTITKNQTKQDSFFDNNNEKVINLNSAQIMKKIFKSIGIELQETSDTTLANIKHPLAELIREYRGYEKQLSAFGQSFLDLVRKDTQRVHPNFNQIGADTGRMSCNNPNMQQIPATEEYRSCFIAPSGRKIVTCDYSQQELRLLASLSGDQKFIKMYEDGVDLHSATASLMYNIPIEEVPKEKRSAAKTINFGLAYGRGAKALADFLGISAEEGEELIKIYFNQFSSIGEWLDKAAKSAQTLSYSQTLMGRKRYYKLPNKFSKDYKSEMARIGRQGKNSPIQGSGVDMIKKALVKIRKKLKQEDLDAFLVNTVHDEIVIEANEKDAQKAYEIIESCMVSAGQEIVDNVPILAEAAINDFWKH